MKTLTLLLVCIVGGCYQVPKTGNPAVGSAPSTQAFPAYRPATAAALAFDPPVAMYEPMPNFSREGRSAAAFVGYEQSTVESYYLYQRDQQRGGEFPDRFDRTAYSTRSSTTFR